MKLRIKIILFLIDETPENFEIGFMDSRSVRIQQLVERVPMRIKIMSEFRGPVKGRKLQDCFLS